MTYFKSNMPWTYNISTFRYKKDGFDEVKDCELMCDNLIGLESNSRMWECCKYMNKMILKASIYTSFPKYTKANYARSHSVLSRISEIVTHSYEGFATRPLSIDHMNVCTLLPYHRIDKSLLGPEFMGLQLPFSTMFHYAYNMLGSIMSSIFVKILIFLASFWPPYPVDRYEHQEERMTLVIKAQEVFFLHLRWCLLNSYQRQIGQPNNTLDSMETTV